MPRPLIEFLPLQPEHLTLLHGWLQKPHVRAFWDDGDRTLDQVWQHYFAERDVEAFLMALDGVPIGYVQGYRVQPADPFGPWRKGITWGMDLFIGDEDHLGQGRGVPLVKGFVDFLWTHQQAQRILIDPVETNQRAIHVYQKAGFVVLDSIEVDDQKLLLLSLDLSIDADLPEKVD